MSFMGTVRRGIGAMERRSQIVRHHSRVEANSSHEQKVQPRWEGNESDCCLDRAPNSDETFVKFVASNHTTAIPYYMHA
jgi:hypothetical protein